MKTIGKVAVDLGPKVNIERNAHLMRALTKVELVDDLPGYAVPLQALDRAEIMELLHIGFSCIAINDRDYLWSGKRVDRIDEALETMVDSVAGAIEALCERKIQ